MNLMVNSLPTRTWNRLGMNEAHVDLEGTYNDYLPGAQVPGGIRWEAAAEALPQVIPGDLDAVTDSHPASLAVTEENVKMEAPLVLTYHCAPGDKAAGRLVLQAGAGSRMRVVLVLSGEAHTSVLETKVLAQKDAVVELYVAQLLGGRGCFHLAGICEENAEIDLTKLELGAEKLYAGANVELRGRQSRFCTEAAYHGRSGQSLDMNYVAVHLGRETESRMQVNGTLVDGAKKVFRGTIDFRKGCAGSVGNETENVLLLGDQMVNQTIPLILCKEEDVEGNHGASIGRLDDKVLFYMGSRGIDEATAQQIVTQARLDAVCDRFPVESVRKQVREFEILRGITHGTEL